MRYTQNARNTCNTRAGAKAELIFDYAGRRLLLEGDIGELLGRLGRLGAAACGERWLPPERGKEIADAVNAEWGKIRARGIRDGMKASALVGETLPWMGSARIALSFSVHARRAGGFTLAVDADLTGGEILTIDDFAAGGKRFTYNPADRRLLAEALKIGTLDIRYAAAAAADGEGSWRKAVFALAVENFKNLTEEQRAADPILLDTGLLLKPQSQFGMDYRRGARVELMLEKAPASDGWSHNIFLVIDGDVANPKSVTECLPKLYASVDRNAIVAALPELANLADDTNERWDFNGNPFGALQYYLEFVYDKLCRDDEAARAAGEPWRYFTTPASDPDAELFCTGLVGRRNSKNGERFIYARCSDKNESGMFRKIEWSMNFTKNGTVLANPDLVGEGEFNHGLPFPANWVGEPERLLFDYRYGSVNDGFIAFNYAHIFARMCDRLEGSAEAAFRREFPASLGNIYYPLFPERQPDRDRFAAYVHRLWRTTRKRLQKNFMMAAPTYFKNKIQLLVPLFVDDANPDNASIALVLTINENLSDHPRARYFCPTCLDLETARLNSRVITRIDNTWLAPSAR